MASAAPLIPLQSARKTEKIARRAQSEQKEQIARQRQTEQAGLAEEEDELARRRLLAQGRSGRRSLIRTSETGTLRPTLG